MAEGLPNTAAAAQKVLGIVGIDYHLSPDLRKKLDDERIGDLSSQVEPVIRVGVEAVKRVEGSAEGLGSAGNPPERVENIDPAISPHWYSPR